MESFVISGTCMSLFAEEMGGRQYMDAILDWQQHCKWRRSIKMDSAKSSNAAIGIPITLCVCCTPVFYFDCIVILEHRPLLHIIIDFEVLVMVKNANPNGDPLNGNRPRETYDGYGEISDVCIKSGWRPGLSRLRTRCYL